MRHTLCAICDTDRWDRPLYAEALGDGAFTSERFSARRLPDRVHYRMVRCENCGLIRSDPVLEEAELAGLYAASQLTYAQEAEFAGDTYARYLREVTAARASARPPAGNRLRQRILPGTCARSRFRGSVRRGTESRCRRSRLAPRA